jgi:hypothetical protein
MKSNPFTMFKFHGRILHVEGVELNLQPTVSQPVRLGVGPSFEDHDQILHVL